MLALGIQPLSTENIDKSNDICTTRAISTLIVGGISTKAYSSLFSFHMELKELKLTFCLNV